MSVTLCFKAQVFYLYGRASQGREFQKRKTGVAKAHYLFSQIFIIVDKGRDNIASMKVSVVPPEGKYEEKQTIEDRPKRCVSINKRHIVQHNYHDHLIPNLCYQYLDAKPKPAGMPPTKPV